MYDNCFMGNILNYPSMVWRGDIMEIADSAIEQWAKNYAALKLNYYHKHNQLKLMTVKFSWKASLMYNFFIAYIFVHIWRYSIGASGPLKAGNYYVLKSHSGTHRHNSHQFFELTSAIEIFDEFPADGKFYWFLERFNKLPGGVSVKRYMA